MQKYIIDHKVHGYTPIEIDDMDTISLIKDSEVVIVASSKCAQSLGNYYKATSKLLQNQNRVILIGIEEDNMSYFKALASLMVTYKAYDIYTVGESDIVAGPYLLNIEKREPDITEVQNYIGGDITAYNDLVTILFGIESLVEEGHIEELRDFLEQHILSIENLTTTIDGMKKKCQMFNSDELFDKIKELQEKNNKLQDDYEQQKVEANNFKHDKEQLEVDIKELRRENQKLSAQNEELSNEAGYGKSVIKTYNTINTQSLQCKSKMILYFKEISYVSYTNTLVSQIQQVLEAYKLKVKLIVYDTQTNLYMTYKPLPIITGRDYVGQKDTLIHKNRVFVVAEPNQSILNDILTSEQCFDVVIVYDRMKEQNDVVSGNNVTKFYIVNSSKDFKEIKGATKITDTSYIITHAHSSIDNLSNGKSDRKFLDIPYINAFNTLTESAKTNKYMRLETSFTGQRLIDTILSKSRINTLITR